MKITPDHTDNTHRYWYVPVQGGYIIKRQALSTKCDINFRCDVWTQDGWGAALCNKPAVIATRTLAHIVAQKG